MNNTGKTCSGCFFGVHIDAQRYKCHVSRPTTNGFPKVLGCDYCSYWTDPETMDRPFFYLLPNASRVWGAAGNIPTDKEIDDEQKLRPQNGED